MFAEKLSGRPLLSLIISAVLGVSITTLASGDSSQYDGGDAFGRIQIMKVIVMPSPQGHADWVQAIRSAQSSIHMTMYHLTDRDVIQALEERARGGLDVHVIVDGKSLRGGYRKAFDEMTASGVQIIGSSQLFNLTHNKDMVVDNSYAFITAINMTNTAQTSRDFGIVTSDANIVAEIESVFATDWQNAQNNTSYTPQLTDGNLAWSPNDSTQQLVRLIDAARSYLDVEVENLGSAEIQDAFSRAAARGVTVRLIIPECSLGNWQANYRNLAAMTGVQEHVEHDGKSLEQPYMHSKMMVADGKYVYVGSINYSYNSTTQDRELGVLFTDENTAAGLASEFEIDWNRSQAPDDGAGCGRKQVEGSEGSAESYTGTGY